MSSNTIALKIGNSDFSDHVIAGSYDVQLTEVYESHKDASEIERRRLIRTKVVGSFNMFFRQMLTYKLFVAAINSAKTARLTVPITVTPNNTDTATTINAFVSFAPVRNRGDDWSDYMEQFTVHIEEA